MLVVGLSRRAVGRGRARGVRRLRPQRGRRDRGTRARAPSAHRPARQQRRRRVRAPASSTAAPETIERVMRVNYLGSVWSTLAFLPGLGAGSHLVNVVSVAGSVAVGPYSASKHAQLAFSRSLAVELAPRGVMVHTVNPGFVETAGFPQHERFPAAAAPPGRSTRSSSSSVCSARSTRASAKSWSRAGTARRRGSQALGPGAQSLAREHVPADDGLVPA